MWVCFGDQFGYGHMWRVGQNHIQCFIIIIRCIYGIFGRGIAKYMVL